MFKIALVNMPFASLALPSIGLAQLKAVVKNRFKDRVDINIQYINQDFGQYVGVDLYQVVAGSGETHNTGLGDWFFRQAAFPDEADNTESFFRRYYPLHDETNRMYKYVVQEKRAGLEAFLDRMITKYRLDQADVVGFTSMFTQNVACFALARRIKMRNPRVLAIMGGANCESPMGQEIVKNVDCIDFVFSGPGLLSFPQFIGHCLNQEPERCHAINGVLSRANCSAPRPQATLGHAAQVNDLGDELSIDELIELDYDLFLNNLERNFPNKEIAPIILFETSRGCWWGEKAHCTFCGLNGLSMAYRAMTPENAIEQFKSVFAYYPKSRRFQCVDNIMPKSYVKQVFPFIDTPPDVTIFYEVKADLSEDDLQVLSRAGVKAIQPGIESLATSTLKLMKKGTTAFQNISFLKHCVTYDIFPEWNLLVGFPGEREEVYQKYLRDIPLLAHLPPPSGVFPVRFDRFSPYFNQAREYGLQLYPVDYYKLTYPFSDQSLANLAYYFADAKIDAEYFTSMVKWIGKVRDVFGAWEERWRDKDKLSRPALFFKQKGKTSVIYDSRYETVVEHEIDEIGTKMLSLLNKPRRISDLESELVPTAHSDVPREMTRLIDKRLLFREGDKYLSLVHLKGPQG
jgi:ribosomal peptide maturation radical SAM protein 1